MSLPAWLRAVLPADTARSWEIIAPHLPNAFYLAGGTALAVHLRHRVSRDLDFFFHDEVLDLDEVAQTLRGLGPFAVSLRSTGTLNGVFSETKVQFLSARGQRQLEPTPTVEGIPVAGIGDILAMKLKVVAQRGELRDYFDLMTIEQHAGRTVEEGLSLYLTRYNEPPTTNNIPSIVRALGYLDDVDEDDALPFSKADIARYWQQRQPQILRALSRSAPAPVAIPLPPAPQAPPSISPARTQAPTTPTAHPAGGSVWVEGYERSDGTRVRGHWRSR